MATTKIEWCDKVWNPITGCSPISEGCQNCYAQRMANRLGGRYGYPKNDPFGVTFHPDRLDEPLHWKKPSRIFVCSMGDLFHKDVRKDWIDEIMLMIVASKSYHTFLILTKRSQRMKEYFESAIPIHNSKGFYLKEKGEPLSIELFKNLWLGVSVENQQTVDERIPILLEVPAAKRFVSVEPMLEAIDLNGTSAGQILGPCDLCNDTDPNCPGCHGQKGLSWVICGGETSYGARPMEPQWAINLYQQCKAADVPFFFKQEGNVLKHDKMIRPKDWQEIMNCHQFPSGSPR
jgi:protein gp37